MPSELAELDGLLRRKSVVITPVVHQGEEEISIPVGSDPDGDAERFHITHLTPNRVTGTVTVYNTRTGEGRPVELNSLKTEMVKTHRDLDYPAWTGKPLYTLDGSAVPKLEIGTLLCPLNPAHPDWPTYKALGAMPCKRRGPLPHELAVESHVRVKHQATWGNMERKRVRDLEDEEREFRRWQMRQSPATAQAAAPTTRQRGQAAKPLIQEICPESGCDFIAESTLKMAVVNKMASHRRTHPEAVAV